MKSLQMLVICVVFGIGQVAVVAHAEEVKLTASDGAEHDHFGHSVSISGDYAIAGALYDDDDGDNSGSAYIYVHEGSSWSQQAKLTASDGAAGDDFGCSVSISGDYALVSAQQDDDNGDQSGSAYIFHRSGSSWTQQAKLLASDAEEHDYFGHSVSISGDYALVSARYDGDAGRYSGSAYIFEKPPGGWSNMTETAKLTASDAAEEDQFGYSVSISGDYALVGVSGDDDNGFGSGSAYAFLRSGTSWSQTDKQTASDGAANDQFGLSVSISGDYALVSARKDDDKGTDSGSAYVYHCVEDLSLPVELSTFTAQAGDGEATLHWLTESEIDNLGFYVYRALSEDGEYRRLTAELIAGAGNTTTEQTYTFTDIRLTNGVTYWYKLEDVAFDGTTTMHGPISVTPQAKEEVLVSLPEKYALSPSYPNPFNPSTTIRYQLSEPGDVRLTIYNQLGQEIRVLVFETQPAGWYRVSWDGRDEAGQPVSSGVYLYRLEVAEEFLQTKKMVVVR